MAQIAPFQGLRFDLSGSQDAAALLAPPYDVITERHREELERRHARNVVHLDLPRGEGDQRYQLAGGLLEQWIAEGTLRRDDRPAIYRYEQRFTFANGTGPKAYVRRGFIALLKLEPFSARVVLPHEHTLSGPKADRLKLMRATRAHFSQVFALYRDPAGEAEALLSPIEERAPDLDATTSDGCRHRLWAIDDPVTIAKVARVMAPKQVMIADGHHRYETMISLRDELRPADRAPAQSLADWGTMFFARAEDPGLLVLPTHRLVNGLPAEALATLPERARPWFTVTDGSETDAHAIEHRLAEGTARVTFALREAGKARTLWLGLRPDADLSALGPPALQGLDVTVLHGLLLGPLLGIDAAAMAKQSFLSYTHDMREALARIEANEVQGGFLMNATQVEQVLAACEAGFVLPQKSTYFQPKLATGLVMARIDPYAHPQLPEWSEGLEEITYDTLLRGRVGLYQPARGFRSSLDPVLLTGFATPPFGRFLDIGCGTGAVSFLLLARDPAATGVGVEIQPRLAALAEKGSVRNGFGERFVVRAGDVRDLADLGTFDLVATNPPFRPLGSGVLPPDRERSLANHEVTLTLAGWLDVATAALAPAGRLCAIFPADRDPELVAGILQRGLAVTRRRFVHPQAGLAPSRVLVEAARSGSAQLEPPLIVHENGAFTAEVRRMMGD